MEEQRVNILQQTDNKQSESEESIGSTCEVSYFIYSYNGIMLLNAMK